MQHILVRGDLVNDARADSKQRRPLRQQRRRGGVAPRRRRQRVIRAGDVEAADEGGEGRQAVDGGLGAGDGAVVVAGGDEVGGRGRGEGGAGGDGEEVDGVAEAEGEGEEEVSDGVGGGGGGGAGRVGGADDGGPGEDGGGVGGAGVGGGGGGEGDAVFRVVLEDGALDEAVVGLVVFEAGGREG